MAAKILAEYDCPDAFIMSVQACIEATCFPQKPETLEACILCDADLYHFTKTDYHKYEEALRREQNAILHTQYNEHEWKERNCRMLIEHHYHTSYGRNVLQLFKELNLKRIECL